MPAKMISEMPLPMPRAVICSPSHIRNMVPPTSVMTAEMRKNMPGSVTMPLPPSRPTDNAVGLHQRQDHRAVARVLVDDLAALLAFLLQRFERRHDRRHQLHDDGGGDVGHDAEREDRHALDGTAGEHVEHAEHAAALRLECLGECVGIDAGKRDVGAEPVDEQRAEREPDALLEVFGLGEGREIQVRGKLFSSRRHRFLR